MLHFSNLNRNLLKSFPEKKNIPMSLNCISFLFSFQFSRLASLREMLKSLSLLISVSVSGLKCFSDVRGFQQTHCSAAGGFKTCFTKFDNSKYDSDSVATTIKCFSSSSWFQSYLRRVRTKMAQIFHLVGCGVNQQSVTTSLKYIYH